MRRSVTVAVGVGIALGVVAVPTYAAWTSGSSGAVTGPAVQANAPAPVAEVVSPTETEHELAWARLAGAVATARNSMVFTEYDHTRRVDVSEGRYVFDCVGMTDYFLGAAAPGANSEMRAQQGISRGRYPSPQRMVDFFSQLPASGTSGWLPVNAPAELRPGDVIAVGSTSSVPGHAMIVAQAPVPRADGSVGVVVFDSTGSPHGAGDSRPGDARAAVGADGKRTGLGFGTIRVATGPSGTDVFWTTSSSKRYGGTVNMARPLR